MIDIRQEYEEDASFAILDSYDRYTWLPSHLNYQSQEGD